eukprot:595395-Prymnesium_polylepis.1
MLPGRSRNEKREGTSGDTTWPSRSASACEVLPVARTRVRLLTLLGSPRCTYLTAKPPSAAVASSSPATATSFTFAPYCSSTPARLAAASSASTIVPLSSVVGKTRPSASRLRTTPSASNHAAVSGGEKRLVSRPVSSAAPRGYRCWSSSRPPRGSQVVASCMTLQRPPPEMRTLRSGCAAASSTRTDAPARAAAMAEKKPAAPPPTTQTSTRGATAACTAIAANIDARRTRSDRDERLFIPQVVTTSPPRATPSRGM